MDGDTGLTNLTIMVYPACINSGTAGTNLSMKLFSQLKEQIETFLRADTIATCDND